MVSKQTDYVFISGYYDLGNYQSNYQAFDDIRNIDGEGNEIQGETIDEFRARTASNPPPNIPSGTEDVSIKGAVPVPVATDFTESKKSINEIVAQKGELASIPNIDLCAFLPKIPNIDIPSLGGGGGPDLGDIMATINGVTLGGVKLISGVLEGALGTLGDITNNISAAIQANVPNISCGAPIAQTIPQQVPAIGSALQSPSVPGVPTQAAVPSVDYGVEPEITVETTSLTVKSIDDELDAGEFT